MDRDCLRFQGVNRWMLYEDSGDPASGVRAGRQGRLRRQTGRKTAPPQEADGRVEVVAASMHSANSIGFLQRLAVQGMGVALLPEIAARPDVRAGRLVRILPD